MLSTLSLKKPWEITVAPHKKRRSTDQNSLLWKWYTHIADYTGHTTEEIHEWCKAQFLPPRIVNVAGNDVEYRSTTKLTTVGMSEFMERVYAWATSELGLFLPVPEEMHGA